MLSLSRTLSVRGVSFPTVGKAAECEGRGSQEAVWYVRRAQVAVVDGNRGRTRCRTRPPDLQDPLENRDRPTSVRGGDLHRRCCVNPLYAERRTKKAEVIKGECESAQWLFCLF